MNWPPSKSLIADISSRFRPPAGRRAAGGDEPTLQRCRRDTRCGPVVRSSSLPGSVDAIVALALPGRGPASHRCASTRPAGSAGWLLRAACGEARWCGVGDLERDLPDGGGRLSWHYVRQSGLEVQPGLSRVSLRACHIGVRARWWARSDYARDWPDPLVAPCAADCTDHRGRVAAAPATNWPCGPVSREVERLNHRLHAENVVPPGGDQELPRFRRGRGATAQALRLALLLGWSRVAPTDSTVLLLGESGTGKDLFAQAVHARSSRSGRPLVRVNCAALAQAASIESELFGHEKGAFTGASALRLGRFEIADGGTLFLDEAEDLPLDLQSRLLRVLQDGEFERLGSSHTQSVSMSD